MKIYPHGTRIGQYEIISHPKMGGMGVVYFALDHLKNDLPVAIKTIKPEFLPDRIARDRFIREGTTWVELGKHSNIVRCYDVQYIDPTAFLVLELIANDQDLDDASLRAWMGRPMPVEQALLFAQQIARGMLYAIEKIPGLVHRDLKPENVLVGADRFYKTGIYQLRITDFGLAAILKDEIGSMQFDFNKEASKRTQLTNGIAGTPLYMAPEQWKREVVGVYTDVYALGCIFYEMLTGEAPVAGKTMNEIRAAHCEGKLRPMPNNLPIEIRALLERCRGHKPNERYGDWREIKKAIEAAYRNFTGQDAPQTKEVADLETAERVQMGSSYNAMGQAYLDLGKAKVAIRYFAQAQKIGGQEKFDLLEAVALNNLGTANADLGSLQRAIKCYEQALEINRRNKKQRNERTILNNLGVAYLNLGDVLKAIECYEQSLNIAIKIGDRRGELRTLNNLGNACRISGDIHRAVDLLNKSLLVAREIDDRRGEATALGYLGIAYRELGDLNRAWDYLEKQLIITREIGDRRGESEALSNIGSIFIKMNDAPRAIGYYEQGLDIAREVGDQQGEAADLGDLGTANFQLGDLKRAVVYYEQQLSIVRQISDRRGEGTSLGNLGNVYRELGDDERAINFYEQALEISQETNDVSGTARHSFNIAALHEHNNNKEKALPLAQEAFRIFSQIGLPSDANRAQQLITLLQENGEEHAKKILQSFSPLIDATVWAALGLKQARIIVEQDLPTTEEDGWHIAEPIHRIWTGERNESILTTGIDPNSALVVREILKRLKQYG